MGDRSSRLAVQLQDWEGNAESLQFPVHLGGEDTAYSLQLTAPVASELGATTVAPNGLSLPFSTWDQDHDLRRDKNCAKSLSGEQPLPLPVLSCGRWWGGGGASLLCSTALPSSPDSILSLLPSLISIFAVCPGAAGFISPTFSFPIFKMSTITTAPTL